jgi:hypothetical protein
MRVAAGISQRLWREGIIHAEPSKSPITCASGLCPSRMTLLRSIIPKLASSTPNTPKVGILRKIKDTIGTAVNHSQVGRLSACGADWPNTGPWSKLVCGCVPHDTWCTDAVRSLHLSGLQLEAEMRSVGSGHLPDKCRAAGARTAVSGSFHRTRNRRSTVVQPHARKGGSSSCKQPPRSLKHRPSSFMHASHGDIRGTSRNQTLSNEAADPGRDNYGSGHGTCELHGSCRRQRSATGLR